MEKRSIYIVLTRTTTVVSRLIRMFKRDEYSHAAISLDRELTQMYSFGRKYLYYPFIGVFNREEINRGIYSLQKEVPCIILELEVSREQYERAKAMIDHFIVNRKEYKYNYRGFLDNMLKIEKCRERRFLCSEFVYYILKESGIADLKMPRNLVRPQTLLQLNGKVVYKGDLKTFPAWKNAYRVSERDNNFISTPQ